MGLGQTFCRKMAKRSYQYMVRSAYDVLPKPPKVKDFGYSSGTRKTLKSSSTSESYPLSKNGEPISWGDAVYFNGERHVVLDTDGKMVIFTDGTKHRASSCIK